MSAPASRRDFVGYALVGVAFVMIGLSGTLATWATAPASVLLVLRFALAAIVLVLVFARRRPFAGVFRRGVWPGLLLMGVLDSFTLLAYFYAVRATGVAIATFLLFIQPVWVALLAPRLLRTPTERVVFLALGIAVAGMGVILVPSFRGGVELSVLGVLAALAAGWAYAFYQIIVKGLTRKVSSVTLVTVECTLDAVFLLPLGLWQTLAGGAAFTGRDLVAVLILGLFCTALAYWMWMEGMGRVRVQHSSILGFLTPVAAPIYALLLLGQSISPWTVAGGVLILGAGVLIVLLGRGETAPEPPL